MSHPTKMVPLAIGAHTLRLTYLQAYQRMLAGELHGERRGARWYVALPADITQRAQAGAAV